MCLAEVCDGTLPERQPGSAGTTSDAPAPGPRLRFPGVAAGAERPAPPPAGHQPALRLTWFGTNGWKIEFAAGGRDRTVLLDPYLARFETGFLRGAFDPHTPLRPADPVLVERHVPPDVDLILVGHGHWDHLADVPAIHGRTGATVIGSETHWHLLRAFGVPDSELVIVEGGEVMAFEGYSIEVFASLHSLGPTKKFPLPGHLLSDPPRPRVVGDLPEGDSLCYLVTIAGGPSLFLMSSANFVERNLSGIRPDVALIAGLFRAEIDDYTTRLTRALGHPGVLLPTHWDDFERPYSDGPYDLRDALGEAGSLDRFVRELREASPGCRVVVLDFFEPFEL